MSISTRSCLRPLALLAVSAALVVGTACDDSSDGGGSGGSSSTGGSSGSGGRGGSGGTGGSTGGSGGSGGSSTGGSGGGTGGSTGGSGGTGGSTGGLAAARAAPVAVRPMAGPRTPAPTGATSPPPTLAEARTAAMPPWANASAWSSSWRACGRAPGRPPSWRGTCRSSAVSTWRARLAVPRGTRRACA